MPVRVSSMAHSMRVVSCMVAGQPAAASSSTQDRQGCINSTTVDKKPTEATTKPKTSQSLGFFNALTVPSDHEWRII
jgi:hypothetical protein